MDDNGTFKVISGSHVEFVPCFGCRFLPCFSLLFRPHVQGILSAFLRATTILFTMSHHGKLWFVSTFLSTVSHNLSWLAEIHRFFRSQPPFVREELIQLATHLRWNRWFSLDLPGHRWALCHRPGGGLFLLIIMTTQYYRYCSSYPVIIIIIININVIIIW